MQMFSQDQQSLTYPLGSLDGERAGDHGAALDVILAGYAHDLCLPVTHIKGFVASLLRPDVEWDAEIRREFLAEIDTETERLAQMLDSLLDVRFVNGVGVTNAEWMLTTPARIIDGGLSRVRLLLGEHLVRIDIPDDLPCLWIDPNRIERALANLLQNAIKYSPSRSDITISARLISGEEVEISVDDAGQGIPAEDRERIFEHFVRTRSSEGSDVAGHGLGLAISRCIVAAHGGRISVSERPGGGTRFSVFLPVRQPTAQLYPRQGCANDTTEHSRSRRRVADAQASVQQSQNTWLRRKYRGRRRGSIEVDPGALV